MKKTAVASWIIGLMFAVFSPFPAQPADAAPAQPPAYHGCYLATAHTGDFDLSVCRQDDGDAIDESVALATRITGSPAYVESVTVTYLP